MMIPVVKCFDKPAQIYGLRTDTSPEFGILHNKYASFETHQGTRLTLPLNDVLAFIVALEGTDQGNIWKTGMVQMMDYYVARTPGTKALWDSVLKVAKIDITPLPPPIMDPTFF